MTNDDRLSSEAIAAIKARADAATPGPWHARQHSIHRHHEPEIYDPDYEVVLLLADNAYGEDDYSDFTEEDTEFIANARTDIPALLRHIDAQRDRIEKLEALLNDADYLEQQAAYLRRLGG